MAVQHPQNNTAMLRLNDQSIGYTIVRSARRKKTISFFIESESRLRVLAPLKMSDRIINSTLQERLPWIIRKIEKYKDRLPVHQPLCYEDGGIISYLGYRTRLRITYDHTTPQGCRLRPRRLTVNLHNNNLATKDLRDEIRLEIMLWLKKRARAKIAKRLEYWSTRSGIPFRTVRISSPQRRWGSCNAQNVIRLNWRLIMAPLSSLDYVVVHELCHVVHKNHGPKFWGLVAQIMPDYRQREDSLDTSATVL